MAWRPKPLSDEEYLTEQVALLKQLSMVDLDLIATNTHVQVVGERTKKNLIKAIVHARLRRRKEGSRGSSGSGSR